MWTTRLRSRRWLSVTTVAAVMESGKSLSMLSELGWKGLRAVTDEDHAVIYRQLAHPLSATIAVGSRCAHGYPQAEILTPGQRGLPGHFVRLSCPHLCQHIDEWEGEGAIKDESRRLHDNEEWKRDLDTINARHSATRKQLLNQDEVTAIRAKYGQDATDTVLNSGIAGLSPDKHNDVKCIHALVADEILADQQSPMVTHFLDTLKSRGCNVAGTSTCHEQCAGIKNGWQYFPAKNKQKLRQSRQRRREFIAAQKERKNTTSSNGNCGDKDDETLIVDKA